MIPKVGILLKSIPDKKTEALSVSAFLLLQIKTVNLSLVYHLMFKKTAFIATFSLLFACATKQDNNIIWYKGQLIEQLEPQGDSVYRVQIGIMASSFWLPTDSKDFKKQLSLLKNSLSHRQPLDIGIEKGSNEIRTIKK